MINLQGDRPTFAISGIAGASRVIRIEVTDAAGFESDEVQIVLDDTPSQLPAPEEGTEIELRLGTGGLLVPIGRYAVEEIERNGFERTLTIFAKAVDHGESLKEPKTRAWRDTTFGEIVETIAGEHGLKPIILDSLASHPVPYLAQTEESDQNLLTRLGRKVGAVVTVKDGHLVVTERRSGKTASGNPIPPIVVSPSALAGDTSYSVTLKGRTKFSKVIANWQDQGRGTTRQVVIEVGEKGPSMTLREPFQSEAEARKAAEAKAVELKAGEGELTLELLGNPHARAEAPVKCVGISADLDHAWIATTVTHIWDYGEDGGATTTIEAEFGKEEGDS